MATGRAATSEQKTLSEAMLRMKRLGRCIRDRRTELGLTQGDVASQFEDDYGKPLMQTTVSRWELGQVALTVEQVHKIEEVLEVRPGLLLASAGYVDLKTTPDDVEGTLVTDPALDAEYRDMVLNFYRQMKKASELSRLSRPKAVPRHRPTQE